MWGVAKQTKELSWEQAAEDFAFIFYSTDLQGRIHYVNQAWYNHADRTEASELLSGSGLNRNVYDLFEKSDTGRFLLPFESLRRNGVSHFEDIVPCHAPNQNRWMLLRMQRLAEEIVFNFYFLRHYSDKAPDQPKISCLLDSGSWRNRWQFDPSPLDAETAIALCPNCALHFYSFLRDHSLGGSAP